MTFTNPLALLLLLALPAVIAIAWPRRSRANRLRETASLIVRSLIVLLLGLALAGLATVQRSDRLATVFLLDGSDSVGTAGQERGLAYVREALAAMAPEDRAGVVVFGAEALVERPVSPGQTLGPLTSLPVRSHTDIAGAIRLGLTLFPDDAARRLVLVSDGGQTVGEARQAAQLAQANGVELSVVSLPPPPSGAEVRLDDLDAPAVLHEGEQFDLTVTVHSDGPASAPLQIFSEGQLVAQQELPLQAGENRFVLPLEAGASGFTTFQAQLNPEIDTFRQNNSLDAFSEVQGPLAVLLVAERPSEARPLAEALTGAGLQVRQIDPTEFPSALGPLGEFAAVVLINVPAPRLAPRQMELLQTYVRDLGHGLVVIGGERSYGPGGYFQTPLEETLPVDMTITDKERLPGMTLLTVIDKSGSMADSGTDQFGWGIPRKVELAKEAIYRSLDLLVPWDRVGVVAFDSAARWVVEPTPVSNIESIKSAVGTLRADGGTDILAGLQLAAQAIVNEPTEVRHIVLLTDGGADPGGIPQLAEELAAQGVTLSVVAIGQGYAPFLEDVAEIGGGRFHFADNPATIPQIFAQETSLASRSYLVEEEFTPTLAGASPILQGVSGLPELQGYVATSPKVTAQVILRGGAEQDPLLAQWQYGLGRAVAWTSDAKGQWAAAWLAWPEFPRFWAQAVRWTIVESAGGALESQVRLVGEQALVSAEVLAPDGSYRNDLTVTLSLIAPDLSQQTLTLRQTAPGLYEGSFRPDQTGTYLLHTVGQEGDELVAAQTRGFVMAYSPEYRLTEIDPTLLPDLAGIGGGQVLALDDPAAAFAHTLPPAQGRTPLWPWLLTAAVLLLPLDVGLRRVIFGRAELRRLWARLRRRLPQAAPVVPPQPSSAGRLLKVKERVVVKAEAKAEAEAEAKAKAKAEVEVEVKAEVKGVEPAPAASSQVEEPEGNTVRRLVAVKKRRRG